MIFSKGKGIKKKRIFQDSDEENTDGKTKKALPKNVWGRVLKGITKSKVADYETKYYEQINIVESTIYASNGGNSNSLNSSFGTDSDASICSQIPPLTF